MHIETFVLGELQTNCYITWCEETYQAIIIDPAENGTFISEKILELQLTPVALVLTHGHFDHVMGALEVKLNFPQIKVMIHQNDMFLLESLGSRVKHWLGNQYPVPPAPPIDQFLDDQQKITFGKESLIVIHTPGHTPGSVCLYDQENIFTGDTLFRNEAGKAERSYSNPQQLKQSLKQIVPLAQERYLWPGHG